MFYHKNWSTIGNEVCHFKVLNHKKSLECVNDTFITLIPKIKDAQRVGEYRPISLCNVIYKLVAKDLANTLKVIIFDIISPNQSAFISGRLIFDNILVAYETLHSVANSGLDKNRFMAIKLDISKAYDRVEWVFLKVVMEKMGFSPRWIELIILCITAVSYSILLMVNLNLVSNPLEALDKVTISSLFCLSFVLRPYLDFYIRQRALVV